jgi:hypothetical protein
VGEPKADESGEREVSVSVKSQRARRRDEQRKLEEEGSCWAVNRVREKEEHQKSKTAKAG